MRIAAVYWLDNWIVMGCQWNINEMTQMFPRHHSCYKQGMHSSNTRLNKSLYLPLLLIQSLFLLISFFPLK